ncbi:hypothetical protein [Mangrovibacterium diazotrophicum]|uniref:Uncharacterized protein n=1 Tax=Mangrovibacterium diazotrophicum TaxID=1261403 RepID=A0A419WAM0_9BACT|nr:hypothetical protein [Mangrovibacterium diazotrophicum]RKD92531.1 hypothetical protein BC643_2905 [Mangrovibacterium diazotrophicum]
MNFTDYYLAKKLKEQKAKYRYEIARSTMEYDRFQFLLKNKRNPNSDGWSIYFIPRPVEWSGSERPDMAFTKRSENISSIVFPEPGIPYGYGDVKGTNDSLIVLLNEDFRIQGISEIEIFIARGQKHNRKNLWYELVDGELEYELDFLRQSAKELPIAS